MSLISRSFFSYHSYHIPKERKSFNFSLGLIANLPSFQNINVFYSKIEMAVKGGVSWVQYRDHKNNFATSLKIAAYLKRMLKDVPLFINTLHSFELSLATDASGVFLEDSPSFTEARKLLGKKAIIGIPVKTMADVYAVGQTDEIDYLSVKIFPSKKTCSQNNILWGIEGLRAIRATTPHRIVAVGGLNLDSAESIYRELYPQDGIAMAGGIMNEENPYLTVQKIQTIRKKVRVEDEN